ncbi:MAG: PilZ domain-containing protein [Acidobacteria bacterium]|nr:PilZ domain-containing protein [Acidobacteriota bacterium]
MHRNEERREQKRQQVVSPAYLCWEGDHGLVEVKATAVNFNASGMAVRVNSFLRAGQIVWCAVPSYGIYARARVAHTRGLFFRNAGLEFLASGWISE